MLECYNQHDIVELPKMLNEIGRGGNGPVYRCHIKTYKDSKRLVCKKEHKVSYAHIFYMQQVLVLSATLVSRIVSVNKIEWTYCLLSVTVADLGAFQGFHGKHPHTTSI